MSWINENRFLAALIGGTVVVAGLLYFVGSMGSEKYEAAKSRFDLSAQEASAYEKLALYPKQTNADGKRKALDEYRKALEGLQVTYQPFRVAEIKNISSQDFTTKLLAADKEVRAAFKDAGTAVPEPFFVGFERYRERLAPEPTTGILNYQLESVKNVLLSLASARPKELKNLFRPALPEEKGQAYDPGNDVARSFPLEITFVGNEKAVRGFFSALNKPDKQFAIIRTLRVMNQKKDPPRASDAKFDPAAVKAGAPALFGLQADPFAAPDALNPPEAQAPAPKAAPTGRILAQVLGTEELVVFVRLEVLQFLPVKKLP